MKKVKLVSLISLGVVLFYILGVFMIYYTAREISSERFGAESRQFNSQFHSCINAARDRVLTENDEMYKDNLTVIKDIVFETGTYGNSASICAILDEEGNLLSKTESAIKLEFCNEYGESYETHIISLEEYLTEDIKTEIRTFTDSLLSSYPRVYRAHFHKTDNGYVPVKIFLEGADFDTLVRVEKEILLSDLSVDLKVGESVDENVSMSTLFYRINDDKELNYNLEKVNEALNESIALIKNSEYESVSGESNKGYLRQTQMTYELFQFNMGGKTYRSFNAMSHNLTKSTFESDEFEEGVIYLGMLFALAGVIIIIASLVIYNKRKNLNMAVNSFTAAAAHELKTPLAVIQNQCECIMENVAPQKNDDYIKSIYDEALKMNELVLGLLNYSKISTGDFEKKKRYDLCEIVKEECRKYEAFAESKGVNICVDIKPEKAVVLCNKELMSLAVGNYISNGIKFAKGDKNVKITLSGEKSPYSIEVYNDGDGISSELKGHLWSVMTKEDKARTSGSGSGMGLAICKKIFDFHGCTYGLRNTENGVVFWVVV